MIRFSAELFLLGDGNDSFHLFTHQREGASKRWFQPSFRKKQVFVVNAGGSGRPVLIPVFWFTGKPEKSIAESRRTSKDCRESLLPGFLMGCAAQQGQCVNSWKESLPLPLIFARREAPRDKGYVQANIRELMGF